MLILSPYESVHRFHIYKDCLAAWQVRWQLLGEYTFEGEAAHAAGAPWRGRSASDATELMNIGWQYAREHLDLLLLPGLQLRTDLAGTRLSMDPPQLRAPLHSSLHKFRAWFNA